MTIEVRISKETHLGNVRRRLKEAAEVIGCDAIQSCQLAATTSDALAEEVRRDGTPSEQPMSLLFGLQHRGRSGHVITSVRRSDGTTVLIASSPLLQGTQAHQADAQQMETARAILSQKTRAELIHEIRVQNEHLRERERQLEDAVQETQAATEAKSMFLANMSHELRTPMNSILGFTKRLLKRLDGKISSRDLDALETVNRNGRHLLGLINDILDLSKIEAGRMELVLQDCSLGELARDVVTQCEPLLAAGKQSIRLELSAEDIAVQADGTKVRQILTNLVSNAVKYSEAGEICITLSELSDPDLGPSAVVGVRDPGEGMTSEQQAKLFQAFTRLDTAATKRAGGTGLGLAISAQYAVMHGGRIDIESTVGEGSLFSLVLPRIQREQERATEAALPVAKPRASA